MRKSRTGCRMKDFDPYEYVGVIAPGAVIAIGLFVQWPAAKQVLLAKEFSLGEFGIFLIFAFIIGHLVQALGNGIERLFFAPVGGMPTNWMLRESCALISPSQRDRVFSKISLAQNQTIEPQVISKSHWYALTREIYALVAAAATLECELLARHRFKSQREAALAIFRFIEAFYNPRRRHTSIGNMSPVRFEEQYWKRMTQAA